MDTVGVPAIDVELATTGATGLVQHRAGLSAVLVAVAEEQVVVTAAAEAREAPSDGTHYVVQWGDTLANIAFRFGVNVDALAWANGITNPELIEIGDLLTIP